MLACIWAAPSPYAAEVLPPDVLAKKVTEEVLATSRANRKTRAGDLAKTAELIETKILPHRRNA